VSERRVVVTRFVAESEESNGARRPVAEGELFWAGAEPEEGETVMVVSTVRGKDPYFSLPLDAVAYRGGPPQE
jgi:hypothetical protein